MRYGKLGFIEFYSCNLQQCLSIDLFSFCTLAVARRVLEISLSILSGNFLGIDSLVSSGTQHCVRCPCGVVRDRAKFFENNILALKWGK